MPMPELKLNQEQIQAIESADQNFTKKLGSATKQIDRADHSIWFDAITLSLDRDGEVVMPKSPSSHIDNYLANPVVLFGHQAKDPAVAMMVDHKFEQERFPVKFQFAYEEYDFAATLFELYSGGFMRACSVGFIPKKVTRSKLFKGQTGVTYTEIELLEISLVTIPSNREALMRSWEEIKGSIDSSFKGNVEKMIEEPVIYDKCGHSVFLDTDGVPIQDCPTCKEKETSTEDTPQEPDEKDSEKFYLSMWQSYPKGITRIYGQTNVSEDAHYHSYELIVDISGNVSGKTTGLRRSMVDDGEVDLDEIRPWPTPHIHIINETGSTKQTNDHNHSISVKMGKKDNEPDELKGIDFETIKELSESLLVTEEHATQILIDNGWNIDKEGRVLSDSNYRRIEKARDTLDDVIKACGDRKPKPKPGKTVGANGISESVKDALSELSVVSSEITNKMKGE